MSSFAMVEDFTCFRKLCQTRKGRWVTLMILAFLVLELQLFLLIRISALSSSVLQTIRQERGLWREGSASRYVGALSGNFQKHKHQSPVPRDSSGVLTTLEMVAKPKSFPSPEEFGDLGKIAPPPIISHVNEAVQENIVHSKDMDMNMKFGLYTSSNKAEELTPNTSHMNPVPSSFPAPVDYSTMSADLIKVQKRNNDTRLISEMKNLLFRSRVIPHVMRPRWSLAPDQEMLDAKREIDNAPTVKNDPELYAPAFWNFSTFKR